MPRLAVVLPHGEEAINPASDTTPDLLVVVLKECVQVGAGDIFNQAHNGFHLYKRRDKLFPITKKNFFCASPVLETMPLTSFRGDLSSKQHFSIRPCTVKRIG